MSPITFLDFEVFGPFEVPSLIENKSAALAKLFEAKHLGLNTASGIYIFVEESQGHQLPVYVGQSQASGFGGRLAYHLNHREDLSSILDDPAKKLLVFLLPLLTENGELISPGEDRQRHAAIDELEWLLIASCFKVNPRLFNKTGLRGLALRVPGYLNVESEDWSHPANALSSMLQVQNKG